MKRVRVAVGLAVGVPLGVMVAAGAFKATPETQQHAAAALVAHGFVVLDTTGGRWGTTSHSVMIGANCAGYIEDYDPRKPIETVRVKVYRFYKEGAHYRYLTEVGADHVATTYRDLAPCYTS